MIIRIPLPPSASSAYAKKVMFMCANKVTLLTFSRLIWGRGKILKGRGLVPASASVPGVGCRMFWYHTIAAAAACQEVYADLQMMAMNCDEEAQQKSAPSLHLTRVKSV